MTILKKACSLILVGFIALFGLNKFVNASVLNVGIGAPYTASRVENGSTITLFRYALYPEKTITFNEIAFNCELDSSVDPGNSLEIDTTFGISNSLYTIDNYVRSGVSYLYSFDNVDTELSYFNFNTLFNDVTTSSTIYIYCYFSVDTSFNTYVSTYLHQLGIFYLNSGSYEDGFNDGYNTIYSEYSILQSEYNQLYTIYNNLQSSYSSLNSTLSTLQQNYDTLQSQYNSLVNNEYSFNNLMWSISAIPFGIFGSMFNFDILGINFFALVTGIITGFIVIWLLKKFIFKQVILCSFLRGL